MELNAFAAIDLVKPFHGGMAQPFELGVVFPLALLQEAEAFADHFTGVAVSAGSDASLDEVVKVVREIDVASWHRKALRYDHPIKLLSSPSGLTRSEERRVGKECRSRWSP